MGKNSQQPIILASRSPRRQELLRQIGVSFELLDFEIDETAIVGEAPREYVERIAKTKALVGWQLITENNKQLVRNQALLAADTSVVLNQQILGKPQNQSHAVQMLSKLSGQTHQVMTCVALANSKGVNIRTSITQVLFAELKENEIQAYCDTGEGVDKAGGYAIQGLAAKFIVSINGSYSGVVGLPLYETTTLLENHFGACR